MSNDCQRQDLQVAFTPHPVRPEGMDEKIGWPAPGAPDASLDCAVVARYLVEITKALGDLSPLTRTVFTLYRSRGLTRVQIAQQLGVPATVVDDMIGEALDALKRCRASPSVAD